MKFRPSLHPAEEVITMTRPHLTALLGAAVGAFLAAAAASFAATIFPLSTFFGVLGYALALWCGWYSLSRLLWWAGTSVALTTQRLVVQQGLLHHRYEEVPLAWIQGVDAAHAALRAGGSAHLSVFHPGGTLVLRQVPAGQQFSMEIRRAQQELLGGAPTGFDRRY